METGLPTGSMLQILIFVTLTLLVGVATWWKVKSTKKVHDGSGKDVFLAGGGLSWLFVAGSITLTNLSTDQLVGMNGNPMLPLAWWERAGLVAVSYTQFNLPPQTEVQSYGCTG